MLGARLIRHALAVVTSAFGALVLGLLVVVLSAGVVLHHFRTSDTERAGSTIDGVFPADVKVDRCHETLDPSVTTYRCRVRAGTCTRSFLFAVIDDSGVTEVDLRHAPNRAFRTPCAVASDPE